LTPIVKTDKLKINITDIQEKTMNDTMTVQMTQRGVVILPKILRDAYNLHPGDTFTLLDLGGVFIISPQRSDIDALADRITQTLVEKGETLESMLLTLREERERYGQES
jgi:bifunctional DNA-binding transcriptional regulator/antitoxin component of YhaV-PrlF toxin-antitoxin module